MIELPLLNRTGLFVGAKVRAFILEPGDRINASATEHHSENRTTLREVPCGSRSQRGVHDALLTAREAVDEALRRLA